METDDFIKFAKIYRTDDIIKFFAQKTVTLFNDKKNDRLDSCMLGLHYNRKTYKFSLGQCIEEPAIFHLPVWEVQNLIFHSIRWSNDYRKDLKYEHDATLLAGKYWKYFNKNGTPEGLREGSLEYIFKILFSMTSEQVLYQDLRWIFPNFNRNYHILVGSEKINKEINVDAITSELFGLNTKDYIVALMIILWLCMKNPDILSAPETLYCKKTDTILTKENITKIVNYFSVSYEEVRKSDTGMLFFSKPFVRTQRSSVLMVSIYLVWRLIADGLYWIVRDYYRERNSQTFVSGFGDMFEVYFQELLEHYIDESKITKIPRKEGQKSADFKISFENATLLFELKSALMGIKGKNQNPDIFVIDDFIKKHIEKADLQLKASESDCPKGTPVIKIIVLYENFLNISMAQAMVGSVFPKGGNTFLATIADIECLICLYKNDITKFNQVIESLVNNENNEAGEAACKELHYELGKVEALTYEYANQEIDYFEKYFANILKTELNLDV